MLRRAYDIVHPKLKDKPLQCLGAPRPLANLPHARCSFAATAIATDDFLLQHHKAYFVPDPRHERRDGNAYEVGYVCPHGGNAGGVASDAQVAM